jgi:carboxyl-terminal processing protease
MFVCSLRLVARGGDGPQSTQQSISVVTGTNTLVPGPNDGLITTVAARMLERNQFLHHPLDDEFSQKFFDRYIETFDPQHIHFTEGDLAEFDSYRTNLDDLTVIRRSVADLTPAYKIFGRFFERLEQRVAFADTLLKNESSSSMMMSASFSTARTPLIPATWTKRNSSGGSAFASSTCRKN